MSPPRQNDRSYDLRLGCHGAAEPKSPRVWVPLLLLFLMLQWLLGPMIQRPQPLSLLKGCRRERHAGDEASSSSVPLASRQTERTSTYEKRHF
jgi:hypothetical protein